MRKGRPRFKPSRPRLWRGRYKRIPGEAPVFHLRGDWPIVQWEIDGEIAECEMVESRAAEMLAEAVAGGKRYFGYWGGGSFVINEYGQVIVPSPSGDGRQVLVGEWHGPLQFNDPFAEDGVFDLCDDRGCRAGDPWLLPYVGSPYNLSSQDEIYYWDYESGCKVLPPEQDEALIGALRSLRPYGAVRFVVTPGGLVLTKVNRWEGVGNSTWEPRYVGRLDFQKWFPKEE